MNILLNKKKKTPKKEVFLKKALLDAQRSLQDAYEGLANVNEPDLIDSYIYELNAANLKYQVILREYKLLETQNNSTCETAASHDPMEKQIPHYALTQTTAR